MNIFEGKYTTLLFSGTFFQIGFFFWAGTERKSDSESKLIYAFIIKKVKQIFWWLVYLCVWVQTLSLYTMSLIYLSLNVLASSLWAVSEKSKNFMRRKWRLLSAWHASKRLFIAVILAIKFESFFLLDWFWLSLVNT